MWVFAKFANLFQFSSFFIVFFSCSSWFLLRFGIADRNGSFFLSAICWTEKLKEIIDYSSWLNGVCRHLQLMVLDVSRSSCVSFIFRSCTACWRLCDIRIDRSASPQKPKGTRIFWEDKTSFFLNQINTSSCWSLIVERTLKSWRVVTVISARKR